uniref:separase n=1 Tax=Meloidogyne incognita TaxID=6306 RepID=A0A914N4F5_MELIC
MTDNISVDSSINGTPSIKKHQAFLNCQKMINRYVITLGLTQTKIFEKCCGSPDAENFVKDDFFNLNRIDEHCSLCVNFAKSCERCSTSLEELIKAWVNLIQSLQQDYNPITREAIQASRFLVHFIIGFCLLEAKYYEAIYCAWEHLKFCNFEDVTSRLVCFMFSYRLEDWQLLGIFLEKEKPNIRKVPFTAGYLLILECFDLVYRFHTETNTDKQILIADEVLAKLAEVCKDDRRTFLYTQSKSILRSVLVLSSRLPNSDITKYNDPIYQREMEVSHASLILRTYDSDYFRGNFSPIQNKMKSSEGFLKFCMAFVDYMEISISYCWDCWDVGLLREAESSSIALWRNNLIFGNAYWTLRSLSFLFFLKSSIAYDSHVLDKLAQCLQALLTPATSSFNHYLSTPKRNIRPSVFRRGSAVDDSFDLETNVSDNNFDDDLLTQELSSMNIHKGANKDRKHFNLETHVSDCFCVFCVSRVSNWAMALELDRLTLLFRRNTPTQFQLFKDTLYNNYIHKVQSLRQILLTSFHENSNQSTNPFKMPRDFGTKCVIEDNPFVTPKRRGRTPTRICTDIKKEKENHLAQRAVNSAHRRKELKTPVLNGIINFDQTEDSLPVIKPNDNEHIPPLLINYLFRAICQSFVERSEEMLWERNVLEDKNILDEAMNLFKQSSCKITNRAIWLLLRHFTRVQLNGDKFLSTNCSPTKINAARNDLIDYGNLFFREWRQRCAHFLIRNCSSQFMRAYAYNNMPHEYPWTMAFYHVESMAPSMRQLARTLLLRKKTHKIKSNKDINQQQEVLDSNDPAPTHNFTFRDTDHFKSLIERLPPEITFVNISLDEENVLWMTRCHASIEPVIIRLSKLERDDPMLAKMSEILESSDLSVRKSMNIPQESDEKNENGESKMLDNEIERDKEHLHIKLPEKKSNEQDLQKAKAFWGERKRLDEQLKVFIGDLQHKWLGAAAPLLLPPAVDLEDNERVVTRLMGLGVFSIPTLTLLLQLYHHISENEWISLSKLLRDNETQSNRDIAHTTMSRIAQIIKQGSIKSSRKCYTLLVVPPQLSHLPWECLPIFEQSPYVMRLPSFHIFEYLCTLEQEIKELPKMVNGRKSFYVLNPSGDLSNTQKRITDFVGQFNWPGLVGEVPTRDQIRLALTESELFLYIGHGSGGRYWRSTVRETYCNAVSILMGCSSIKIYDEGPGFDGRSSLYEYLIARCPCVVGCLWMVTDGEIDRFFMALMEYCFMESSTKNDSKSKNKKMINSKRLVLIFNI